MPSADQRTFEGLLPTAAIAFALTLSALVGPAVALQPRLGEPVALIAPPWAETGAAEAAVVSAGGVVAARAGLAIVAQSSDPRFLTRLNAAGGFLLLDAARLAALCGVATNFSAAAPVTPPRHPQTGSPQ